MLFVKKTPLVECLACSCLSPYRPPAAASAFIKAEGASGTFKVDKLQIGTDRKIAGEFSLAEAFPGTKLTFKCVRGAAACA